jgi:hypothetical protein
MEPKTNEEEVRKLTPEEEAERDFAAGFSGEPEEGEYIDGEEVEQEFDGEEESEGEEPPEEPIIEEFGMTASQLRERLAQIDQIDAIKQRIETDFSKVYGKFGEVQRVLQQQGPGRLNKVALKRIREEFPELASRLEEDLADSIGAAGPAPDFKELVEERLQQVSTDLIKRYEERLLARDHPDYKKIATDPDFDKWIAEAADEDTKKQIRESTDSIWLSGRLTEFKEWRQKREESTKSSAKRLERAVAPEGRAPRSPKRTDYDDFLAGFKSARKQA